MTQSNKRDGSAETVLAGGVTAELWSIARTKVQPSVSRPSAVSLGLAAIPLPLLFSKVSVQFCELRARRAERRTAQRCICWLHCQLKQYH
jgi:hypothetical protein